MGWVLSGISHESLYIHNATAISSHATAPVCMTGKKGN